MPAMIVAALAVLGLVTTTVVFLFCFHSLLSNSQHSAVPKTRRRGSPTHVLIVLGSGGHTAEMLSMLRRMPLDPTLYTFRTYIVTSGDGLSAAKAADFEKSLEAQRSTQQSNPDQGYEIITVPRARRVHQSFFTAPFSTIQCFSVCLQVLRGTHPSQQQGRRRTAASPYPDLILTNGPATAVCIVLGAKMLRFWAALRTVLRSPKSPSSSDTIPSSFPLRTIFIESWARVTTLSLSGKILLPLVDRFLVQWPELEGKQAWNGMRRAEYIGTIID